MTAASGFRPPASGLVGLLVLGLLGSSFPACKQQDAAIRVNIGGQFRIPQDADQLVLDVQVDRVTIAHQSYALAPPTSLPVSVVLVQSGASHPTVQINVTLGLANRVVGRGTLDADFADGKTVDVQVAVLPQ